MEEELKAECKKKKAPNSEGEKEREGGHPTGSGGKSGLRRVTMTNRTTVELER